MQGGHTTVLPVPGPYDSSHCCTFPSKYVNASWLYQIKPCRATRKGTCAVTAVWWYFSLFCRSGRGVWCTVICPPRNFALPTDFPVRFFTRGARRSTHYHDVWSTTQARWVGFSLKTRLELQSLMPRLLFPTRQIVQLVPILFGLPHQPYAWVAHSFYLPFPFLCFYLPTFHAFFPGLPASPTWLPHRQQLRAQRPHWLLQLPHCSRGCSWATHKNSTHKLSTERARTNVSVVMKTSKQKIGRLASFLVFWNTVILTVKRWLASVQSAAYTMHGGTVNVHMMVHRGDPRGKLRDFAYVI